MIKIGGGHYMLDVVLLNQHHSSVESILLKIDFESMKVIFSI
jgi:hypothetical protein